MGTDDMDWPVPFGRPVDQHTGIRLIVIIVLYDLPLMDSLEHFLLPDGPEFFETHLLSGMLGVENPML